MAGKLTITPNERLVAETALLEGYRQMARDVAEESEATPWVDDLLADAADEHS
jgi:hypothetical protein